MSTELLRDWIGSQRSLTIAIATMRIGVQEAAESIAIEWPPFAFRQRKPVCDRVQHGGVVPEPRMAALDLDVFRRCALLLAAALPRDNAIATGIDCRARHRRWKLHGFAVGPIIDLTSAQDFVEPPGVARLWLVGEWAAERDHLTYQVR